MPTKSTPSAAVARCTCTSAGDSALQGTHHEAHTFSTTTWPRRLVRASVLPDRVLPEIVDSVVRPEGGKTVAPTLLIPGSGVVPLVAGELPHATSRRNAAPPAATPRIARAP